MMKWLTSLVLLFVLGSSALAGMPFQHDAQEHSMPGMMDCCKKAHAGNDTPEVAAAKLCCALNCTQSGSTVPTNQKQPDSSSIVIALRPPLIRARLFDSILLSRRMRGTSSAQNLQTQPAYIFHLALLI